MEERDIIMIRQSAQKNAIATVDVEERTGYFKKKDNYTEDVPARINLWYNKYLEQLTDGTNKQGDFNTTKSTTKSSVEHIEHVPGQQINTNISLTEKQRKAVYAVSKNNSDYLDELIDLVGGIDLSDCLNKMTKAQAKIFLDGKLTRSNNSY